jgi:hypothetical protein
MCATSGERKYRNKRLFVVMIDTIYISNSNCNQMCIIHKWKKKHICWSEGFVHVGESQQKANVRVLEDVTSFLSNSTESSNSSQQWGLKSLEEILVKNEITGYNEG